MVAHPRWKTLLTEKIENTPHYPPYALATKEEHTGIPRVRSFLHKYFVSLSSQIHLLVGNTDARSIKVNELSPTILPNSEIVWWLPPQQYRIVAHARVLHSPGHTNYNDFPFEKLAPSDVNSPQWWESQRVELFNERIDSIKRATFCRPPPGTPLPPSRGADWPKTLPKSYEAKTDEERRLIEQALNNFALVVLEPVRVELVDYSVNPETRTSWTYIPTEGGNGRQGVWRDAELVP